MTEQPFNTPQLFHPLQRRIRDILIGLNPNIFHHVDTILKCLLDRYPNDPVTPADIISAAEAASSYFLVIPENDSVFIRAVDPISWTHNLQSSPGPSRRTTAIISTPPATTFRSVPPSPTKTFSESQLKRLRKEWEKDESKVQLVEDVLGKVGVIKAREDLISIIGDVLEDRPLDRSFSTMKVSDYHCLFADNAVDLININHASLLSLIPDDSIPSSFLEQLYITRLVSSRGLESGARKVINIFIDNAVFVARSVFQEPRLIVDQETELEPTVVVELNCKVHGPLDYVTARAKGRISMDYLMNIRDGIQVGLEKPFFILVETKRTAEMDKESNLAQLLAQIKAVQVINGHESQTGAMTDVVLYGAPRKRRPRGFEIITYDPMLT